MTDVFSVGSFKKTVIAKQILFFKDTKKCDPHSNNELNEKDYFQ